MKKGQWMIVLSGKVWDIVSQLWGHRKKDLHKNKTCIIALNMKKIIKLK